ncbi:hypothetical protein [Shinella sp. M31]|uniref:hypothetical protein n=1 Tax=Shinella sp. M31 TaxID=3368615 RepID=UPI003B9DF0EB
MWSEQEIARRQADERIERDGEIRLDAVQHVLEALADNASGRTEPDSVLRTVMSDVTKTLSVEPRSARTPVPILFVPKICIAISLSNLAAGEMNDAINGVIREKNIFLRAILQQYF